MADSTATETPAATPETDAGGLPLGLPRWLLVLVPLLLLAGVLGVFVFTTPFASFQQGEPLPDVTVTHHTLPDDNTMVLHVRNNGPEAVTVSQVLVDDAYWQFTVDQGRADTTLQPRESAEIVIPYHWESGWDYGIALVLESGATVHHDIVAAQSSPGLTGNTLGALALIGVFVGVIPVVLGMLWFPVIRTMQKRWLDAILVFAAGVLAFLAFDATFEALEFATEVPGVFEGQLLFVLGVFAALLLVGAISAWRRGKADPAAGTSAAEEGATPEDAPAPTSGGLWLAYLVALSIGLHNLAEGLAIGSSFALGRVSLGAFLVLGFMLHNVTEGPAVVAPLAEDGRERPALWHFGALGLVAGAPVILGGWIGSLWLSPTVGVFFLALGVGAILQVDWEIFSMVQSSDGRVATPLNMLAFLAGLAIMYVTDIFVTL